jgi:hypothetical protein
MKVAHAVAAAARDLGLSGAGDDLAVCRSLPAMLKKAHRFNAMAATRIGAKHGGRAGLARALGISESAVDRAMKAAGAAASNGAAAKTAAALSSASAMARFLALLGRHSKTEIRRRFGEEAAASANGPDRTRPRVKLPTFSEGAR